MTSLHYAAVNDHKDMVELLLVNRADVNSHENDFGWTPLCVFRRKSDTIPILIGQGSNPFRTLFRFNSDRVPGVIRTVFRCRRNGVRNGSE